MGIGKHCGLNPVFEVTSTMVGMPPPAHPMLRSGVNPSHCVLIMMKMAEYRIANKPSVVCRSRSEMKQLEDLCRRQQGGECYPSYSGAWLSNHLLCAASLLLLAILNWPLPRGRFPTCWFLRESLVPPDETRCWRSIHLS